ncbi:MAG: hypothetical protein KDD38_04675 [Bdellovibrionales bacterium]|nr:hypothetical protein [Bdellovibrionales bacterium]
MLNLIFRFILAVTIVISSPGWAQVMDYIPSSLPEFYYVGQSGQIVTYMRHIYSPEGQAMTQFVEVDYSQGAVPGVQVGSVNADAYMWHEVNRQAGHIAPEGDATMYDYSPAEGGNGSRVTPGKDEGGKGAGGGTATGIDPGYAMVGQFVIGMIRMNGNSNFLVAGVSTSAAQKIAENLRAVGGGIAQLHFVSSALDKNASGKAGTVVPLPKGFTGNIESTMGDLVQVDWPYKPITFSDAIVITDKAKVKDLLKNTYESGDLNKMMEESGLVSGLAAYPELSGELSGIVNDGVYRVYDGSGNPGPFNDVQFQTPSQSPLGRALRRAANKNQVAWKKAISSGNQKLEDVVQFNRGLLNIADSRIVNRQHLSDDLLKQAEGLIYAAEKSAEFMSGLKNGFKSSVLDMAETIYAIPEIGESLYDYMKAAYNDPAAAVGKAADVMSKTPEFTRALYDKALKRIREIPDMSATEFGELMGELSAEVAVYLGTSGAASAGMKAAKVARAARMGKALAETRAVSGVVSRNIKKIASTIGDKFGVDGPFKKASAFLGDFPKLEEKFVRSFTSGVHEPIVVPRGRTITQAQNLDRPIGQFFGLPEEGIPVSPSMANDMLNIKNYGNYSEKLTGYRVIKDIPAYYGPIEGGTINQIVIPKSLNISDYLEKIYEIRY